MTLTSKPDLSETPQLGRYVDFIETKKNLHTPVRRSCRNRQGTPRFPTKDISNRNIECEKDTDVEEEKQPRDSFDALDDLCTYFQNTLQVQDSTLEVRNIDTKRITPDPKIGRVVEILDDGSASKVTPVKRSSRLSNKVRK